MPKPSILFAFQELKLLNIKPVASVIFAAL